MDKDQINNLAERITHLISVESGITDFSSIQKSLDRIHGRLDELESGRQVYTPVFIPSLSPTHPSQERFNIAEAIADDVFAKLGKEKACTFEPNDKPCDHCAMCSSRGF